jgi:cephalosporin-C deacetylase-like acetyl esterase
MSNEFVMRDFFTQVGDRKVPGSIWIPRDVKESLAVVFVGHGGSGHKKSQLVLDIVDALLLNSQFAVVAIDGPVHGDRRSVFMDGPEVRQEFRELWASGLSIDPMVEDWKSCIEYVSGLPEVDASRMGWYGISMGTAYGIPVVAAEPRLKAASLGMWGTCRPPTERLVADAKKISVPVLFQVKDEDEIFTPIGQQDLYNNISSKEKNYQNYPGGHTDPKDQQLSDIVQFLSQHLLNAQ